MNKKGSTIEGPALARELFTTMVRIRRTEERILEFQLAGRLTTTMCHVSIGQEAVAAGVCRALEPGDYISSTHRGHGHYVARGGSLHALVAELLGRQDGACMGRGGSMHLVDARIGHLGSNAIVGGHVPIATGAAMWSRLSGDGKVSVAFFGDGAITEGIFHEAANFAAVFRLPVVFVMENNQYAMSMPWSRAVIEYGAATRAASYGMPGVDVDGQDPLAVHAVAREAVERARSAGGPTFIGAQTYRFYGHSRADASPYRDPEEETIWRERDPLSLMQHRLEDEGIMTSAQLEEVEAAVHQELDEAVRSAEQSPPASLEAVLRDVYAAAKGSDR